MKKLLCLLLTFCLLCFAGCGDNHTNPSAHQNKNGIEVSAMAGKLEGIKYGLGASVDEVSGYYKKLADDYEAQHSESDGHDHSHDTAAPFYMEKQKEGYTILDISTARFYFENNKKDKGVAAIATDGEIFGFTPGVTAKYEVEEAISAKGKVLNAGESELCLLAVRTEPVLVLRYKFEDFQLDFYFYDNVLITTAISNTKNWKI
jgi:hypothetical protein